MQTGEFAENPLNLQKGKIDEVLENNARGTFCRAMDRLLTS
jgi:hypothetical protein